MSITIETVVTKSPHVVSRDVDGEAVLVEPQNAMVSVISDVGTTIWGRIDGQRTVGDIVETIMADYDVSRDQAMSDAKDFLADLLDKALITVPDTEGP